MHQCCNRSTCDLFQMSSPNNSLSMVFPTFQSDPLTSSPSPSVDCTLSLGTPSTRQSCNDMIKKPQSNSFMSNLCWAPFHAKRAASSTVSPPSAHKSIVTAGKWCANNSTVTIVNGDPLLARRCANCDTTSTPLWRNGPRGPKSLCNACGIRYKKEERRATTTSVATGTTVGAAPTPIIEPQHLMSHHHAHAWSQHGSQSQFRFMEGDQTNGAPFFTWHVSDRTSLVHD